MSIETAELDAEYVAMVQKLRKPPGDIAVECNDLKLELIHAGLGIAGEAGEIVDTIKKHTIYNKPLDRENLIEELGDMEWFMAYLRDLLSVSREEVIKANMAKLSKRYASGAYSNTEASERRDKDGKLFCPRGLEMTRVEDGVPSTHEDVVIQLEDGTFDYGWRGPQGGCWRRYGLGLDNPIECSFGGGGTCICSNYLPDRVNVIAWRRIDPNVDAIRK